MNKTIKKKHILVVHTENEPGVLNRIASLFRRRRFNIESIAAGPSEKDHITRITIVLDAEKTNVEQAIKQMYKIVNVLKITEFKEEDVVSRELALIKVRANKGNRSEVNELIDMNDAKIVDLTLNSVTAELSAESEKIDKFIELMKNFGVKEVVRTGLIAIQKSNKS